MSTATTILTGRDFKLYGVKNGVLIPACGSRSGGITINAEINEATKPIDSYWQSNYAGKRSYTISDSGMCILNPDKFTHTDMVQMIWSGTPMIWVMRSSQNVNEFYGGTALISSFNLTADQSDLELYTLNATGDGELLINNPYIYHLIAGNTTNAAIGNDDILIGYLETGGLPPINDN